MVAARGWSQTAESSSELYREKYRPQFHFSSSKNWLNDPNGLVFYQGEYHLFFQYNPTGLEHRNMHWGHAISRDLVHWVQLPVALYLDKEGSMYSGSAVVDWNNTSGFGKDGKPPLVLIYTGTRVGQCLAYSLDGRTFTKYGRNPVLGNVAPGNRDPKVIWHEPTKHWIMILYVQKDRFDLFRSPNLKDWMPLKPIEFKGAHECPDLFPIARESDPKQVKWAAVSASGSYVIGSFDGNTFNVEHGPIDFRFGYAVQTFSDEPNGRRIQIAWLSNKPAYPGMPFNQQMTVPVELRLRSTPTGPRLFRWPVKELDMLRTKTLSSAEGLTTDCYDIEGEAGEGVVFKVRGHEVPVRRGKFRLLVDRITIELFLEEGAQTRAMTFMPDDTAQPLLIKGEVKSLKIHELCAAWRSAAQ
jgi:sucrose-6-phosphate hydrolase SacC (GH32 family)